MIIEARIEIDIQSLTDQFVQLWVRNGDCQETIRWKTVESIAFLNFVMDHEIPVHQISADTVGLYRKWLEKGRPNAEGPSLKQTTLRKKLVGVSETIRGLYFAGVLQDIAWAERELFQVKIIASPISPLSDTVIREIMRKPDMTTQFGARDLCLLYFVAFRGCTVQAIHLLDMDDIDREFGIVTVEERENQRKFQLSSIGFKIFRLWVSYRHLYAADPQALFVSLHWTSGRNKPGSRLSERSIRAIVDGYLDEAGVKIGGLSSNALRNAYFAYNLMDPEVEGKILDGILPEKNK